MKTILISILSLAIIAPVFADYTLGIDSKGLITYLTLARRNMSSSAVFYDITPYNNNGTVADTFTFVPDWKGVADGAMYFSYNPQYNNYDEVRIANTPILELTPQKDLSICLWFKWDFQNHINKHRAFLSNRLIDASQYPVKIVGVLITNGGTTQQSSHWGKMTGKLFYGPVDEYTVRSDSGYNDGNWHHLVLTIDRDDEMKLFLDGGVPCDSIDISARNDSDLTTGRPWTMGTDTSTIRERPGLYFFNGGAMCDVKFYNRVLSPGEIGAMYRRYRPTYFIKP